MDKKITKNRASSARAKALNNIRMISPLVSLQEVRLLHSRFDHISLIEINQIDNKVLDDLSFEGKQLSRVLSSLDEIRKSKKLIIESRFALRSHCPKADKQKIAIYNISASFQIFYQFRPEGIAKLTVKALSDFANVNSIINVWPYWRELAHSLVARAGLFSSSPVPTITADRLLPPAQIKS